MAVTLASLRAAHPEFTDTPDDVLNNAISAAENRIDTEVYGDRADDATMLLACHLAAATVYGGGGELTRDQERTVYYKDYEDLAMLHGAHWRVW